MMTQPARSLPLPSIDDLTAASRWWGSLPKARKDALRAKGLAHDMINIARHWVKTVKEAA
jgi:hypothetical protein